MQYKLHVKRGASLMRHGHVKLARAASSHHPARCKVHQLKTTKATPPTNSLCSTRATDLCIDTALIPLMGSQHGKQKNSTVNKNKTKIQSRKSQDLIYEDRSNEMHVRLTLEDSKAYEIRSRCWCSRSSCVAIRQHFRTRSCVRCRWSPSSPRSSGQRRCGRSPRNPSSTMAWWWWWRRKVAGLWWPTSIGVYRSTFDK